MKPLQERILELAILQAQQEMIRKFVVDVLDNYRDGESNADMRMAPIRQYFHNFCRKVEEYEATQFNDLPNKVTISGYCENENISHYDIDMSIDEQGFEGVSTDSESGGFYCYCTEDNVKQVTDYLDANWESLSYKWEVDEGVKKIFRNHNAVEELLENIEVPSPLGYLESMVKTFEDMKAEYEQKIKDAELSLYKASNEFAKEQLSEVDRKIVDEHKNKLIEIIKEDYAEIKAFNTSDRDEKYYDKYQEDDIAEVKDYLDKPVYCMKRALELISYQIHSKIAMRYIRDYRKSH